MTFKKCFRCKELLCTSLFHKDISHKDGLRSSCKNCKRSKQYFCEIKNEKQCLTCKDIKSLSEFFPNKKCSVGGVSTDCRSCFYKNIEEKEIKKCSRCKIQKETYLFSKNSYSKDGKSCVCKQCISKSSENIRYNRDENITKSCHLCKIDKPSSEFYTDTRRKDGLCSICSTCTKIKTKKWAQENKPILNKNYRERKKKDPMFKLSCNLRSIIKDSFKRACEGTYRKSVKTENILGCTIEDFINHLQSKFFEGMTLENHGNCEKCWHIDHIYPVSKAKTEEEIIKLNHYTNLQPLWSRDNLIKGNKINN